MVIRLGGPNVDASNRLFYTDQYGYTAAGVGEGGRLMKESLAERPPCITYTFACAQYLEALVEQRQLQLARRTFDRALQSLPITQHDRVWVPYLVRLSDRTARLCVGAISGALV